MPIAEQVRLQLYVIGGHDGEDNYLAQGYSFTPLTNVSGNFSAMPAARSHFAAGSPDNTTILGMPRLACPLLFLC